MFTNTPQPPYFAVIFTSLRTEIDENYAAVSDQLEIHAKEIDGYLGIDSVRDELGITVSYWRDMEAIQEWRVHPKHVPAKAKGKSDWYKGYTIRICKVEYDNVFQKD